MNAIRIIHAVPLSESILLLVVEIPTNGNSDAILLAALYEDALLPGFIANLEQTLPLPIDIQSGEDSIDVTFEIEKGLYGRTKRWCAEVGISVEQLALAFIRFCACADNHIVLKEWLKRMV